MSSSDCIRLHGVVTMKIVLCLLTIMSSFSWIKLYEVVTREIVQALTVFVYFMLQNNSGTVPHVQDNTRYCVLLVHDGTCML